MDWCDDIPHVSADLASELEPFIPCAPPLGSVELRTDEQVRQHSTRDVRQRVSAARVRARLTVVFAIPLHSIHSTARIWAARPSMSSLTTTCNSAAKKTKKDKKPTTPQNLTTTIPQNTWSDTAAIPVDVVARPGGWIGGVAAHLSHRHQVHTVERDPIHVGPCARTPSAVRHTTTLTAI
eukprot:3938923-Rhodomonas_salina.3